MENDSDRLRAPSPSPSPSPAATEPVPKCGQGCRCPSHDHRFARGLRDGWARLQEQVRTQACLTGVLSAGLLTTWELQTGSPLGSGDGPRTAGLMERSEVPARALGRRRLVRATAAFLESLGATPGAVAGSLYMAGVRGERGDPAGAPLAAFLAATLTTEPGVDSVSVAAKSVTIVRRRRRRWWRRPRQRRADMVAVPLPAAVSTFAAEFEGGSYSLLARSH